MFKIFSVIEFRFKNHKFVKLHRIQAQIFGQACSFFHRNDKKKRKHKTNYFLYRIQSIIQCKSQCKSMPNYTLDSASRGMHNKMLGDEQTILTKLKCATL